MLEVTALAREVLAATIDLDVVIDYYAEFVTRKKLRALMMLKEFGRSEKSSADTLPSLTVLFENALEPSPKLVIKMAACTDVLRGLRKEVGPEIRIADLRRLLSRQQNPLEAEAVRRILGVAVGSATMNVLLDRLQGAENAHAFNWSDAEQKRFDVKFEVIRRQVFRTLQGNTDTA